MRSLARVLTDRRWMAPLGAMALGFGLFLGVAVGPGASGSLAGGTAPIIALAEPDSDVAPEKAEKVEASGEAPIREAGGGEEEAGFSEEPFGGEEFNSEPVAEPEPEAEEASPPPAEPEPEPEEEEEAETVALKGTVVRVNPAAGSYTLAGAGGELVSLHAPKLPQIATRLAVEAVPLGNETFAEEERQRKGSAQGASFAGVVTYVDADPLAPAYTVSGRGSSLLVHAVPSAFATLPVLGAYAKVLVALEELPAPTPPPLVAEPAAPETTVPAPPAPCAPDPALRPPRAPALRLVQRELKVEALEPSTYLELAAVVSAICPATAQIMLSADDLRESEADLTLTVPSSISTAELELGQPVLATAEVDEAGALILIGLASDEGRKGAEDSRAAQGDLAR